MTNQEYENKKQECWEECCKTHPLCNTPVMRLNFDWTFDRAYALGKQTETITHEEIKEAAREAVREEYLCEKCPWKGDCDFCGGENTAFDCCECPADSYEDGFKAGANFALGKQEKDADAVIQGWVAIDEAYGQCFLHTEKPIQKAQPIADTGDYNTVWDSKGQIYLLDTGLFPDMDSDSDPEEVEIIIKRKKK